MKNVQKGGDRVSLLSILKPTEILSDRCLQSVEIVGEVPSLDFHWMITGSSLRFFSLASLRLSLGFFTPHWDLH